MCLCVCTHYAHAHAVQDMGHSLHFFLLCINHVMLFLQPYCIELEPATIVLSEELQTAVQVRKPLQVHTLTSMYMQYTVEMHDCTCRSTFSFAYTHYFIA